MKQHNRKALQNFPNASPSRIPIPCHFFIFWPFFFLLFFYGQQTFSLESYVRSPCIFILDGNGIRFPDNTFTHTICTSYLQSRITLKNFSAPTPRQNQSILNRKLYSQNSTFLKIMVNDHNPLFFYISFLVFLELCMVSLLAYQHFTLSLTNSICIILAVMLLSITVVKIHQHSLLQITIVTPLKHGHKHVFLNSAYSVTLSKFWNKGLVGGICF